MGEVRVKFKEYFMSEESGLKCKAGEEFLEVCEAACWNRICGCREVGEVHSALEGWRGGYRGVESGGDALEDEQIGL